MFFRKINKFVLETGALPLTVSYAMLYSFHAYASRNVDTFPVLKSDTTSSKTLSFLLQSLNGTI